jgi:uncharacterized repeat protein (TIGR03987 family)
MDTSLSFAIIFITLALVFYSIGVWTERYYGMLKRRHHALFWLGFIFDTTGTTLMTIISHGFSLNLHAITGVIAIVVMFSHAVWATVALHKRDEKTLRSFHKYSLIVWVIWLIPYFLGFALNIPGI